MKRVLAAFVLLSLFSLTACTSQPTKPDPDQAANALFDSFFDEWVSRSPTWQTSLGIKDDYDKWDDLSEAAESNRLNSNKIQLDQLDRLDKQALSRQTRLSYELMERALNQDIARYEWRLYDYPVNQMFGWHSSVPAILINQHTITNLKDAEDYIARIHKVRPLFDQLIGGLELRAQHGIIAPKFVFPMAIDDCKNIIQGAPFNQGDASPIFADFKRKIDTLEADDSDKARLILSAESALKDDLLPAYQKLIGYLNQLEKRADNRSGAWKFPRGLEFYDFALKQTTTTDLTAEKVHELGLAEVARIQNDMRKLMQQVNYSGTLKEFFSYLKNDDQFYFPDTDAGRQAYLDQTQDAINAMEQQLGQAFISKPKAALQVKRVEEFREKSAGQAFYDSPPPDGSRPGIYYANLYDMRSMPKYEMEALLYHEGLPGHHLQLSIANELKDLPKFRKYGHFTAYVEGWGLYAEFLPKEMGFYQNPYSDLGRLSMELWRACRLVTDTGLHAKKWTREQAIQYLLDNTPTSDNSASKAIERYIVMPSQATAYTIGMMKILELRKRANDRLGTQFSLKEFHEVVLSNGALPLSALEQLVESWIQKTLIGL